MHVYHPSQELLCRYAQVFLHAGLRNAQGVKSDDVIFCPIPETARPLYEPMQEAILAAAAHPIMWLTPEGTRRGFFGQASDAQIDFFPADYALGHQRSITGRIAILAPSDPFEMEGIDQARIHRQTRAWSPLRAARVADEIAGRFSWTLGLYGTPGLAAVAQMPLQRYWDKIIAACRLDAPKPVKEWRRIFADTQAVCTALTAMQIDRLHIEAEGTDLWITIGQQRQWVGGSGRNVPSYERFISPDCRETHGVITFSYPLYLNGTRIEGIRLVFNHGRVINATATQNQTALLDLIAQPDCDTLGEIGLTDNDSDIDEYMGHGLFDENAGGQFGGLHLALGASFPDTYTGNAAKMTPTDWAALGFNNPSASIHVDIITTADRVITAYFADGTGRVIFRDGRFLL